MGFNFSTEKATELTWERERGCRKWSKKTNCRPALRPSALCARTYLHHVFYFAVSAEKLRFYFAMACRASCVI